MIRIAKYLAAAAAIGAIASPALAQYPAPQPYPQQYPQSYPQQYPQAYPQQGYAYPQQQQQGYSNNPVQSVIDQLLGNRYAVNDRTAVQQCATAAVAEASSRYRSNNYGQGYNQYQQPYASQYPGQYGQQYGQAYAYGARVTAITNVERRNNGVRVSGTLDSGRFHRSSQAYGTQGYNNQQGYGYSNRGVYGDLTFRCNVDYRGAVTNVRVRNNDSFRRPY